MPPTNTIRRNRVTETLFKAVTECPLVLLTAPVGYGKTIAARELMHKHFHCPASGSENSSNQNPARPFAYYMSAKPGEGDPEYLWDRHLALMADGRGALGGLLKRFPQPLALEARSGVIEALKELLTDRPMLLVIDDFHHLHDKSYCDLLLRLIYASVPGLSFLLLARSRPALPLEELLIKGQCRYFGADLLSFRQSEAQRFFKSFNIDCQEFIKNCWRDTEGWIAPMRLEVEEFRRSGKRAQEADLHNFFRYSVCADFKKLDRQFLIALSALDNFSEDQAAEITADESVRPFIRRLAADAIFLTFDSDSGRYRFHRLFRAYCRSRLSDTSSVATKLPGGREKTTMPGAGLKSITPLFPTDSKAGQPRPSVSEKSLFTARERQFIEQMLRGLNNRQIAEHFEIKRITVVKALGNVYRKLGVKNRAEAISALLSSAAH